MRKTFWWMSNYMLNVEGPNNESITPGSRSKFKKKWFRFKLKFCNLDLGFTTFLKLLRKEKIMDLIHRFFTSQLFDPQIFMQVGLLPGGSRMRTLSSGSYPYIKSKYSDLRGIHIWSGAGKNCIVSRMYVAVQLWVLY